MAGLGRRSHYRKHLTDAVLHDLPEPDFAKGERIAKVVGTRGSNQFEIVVSLEEPNGDSNNNDDPTTAAAAAAAETSTKNVPQLAILPTKFRKLVWLKRNDFVLVQCAQDDSEEGDKEKEHSSSKDDDTNDTTTATTTTKEKQSTTNNDISGGIRYLITHILYKDQVKHLVQKGMWPSDPFFDSTAETATNVNKGYNTGLPPQENDDSSEDIEGEEEYGVVDNDDDDNDDGITYEHSGAYDDDYFVNTNRIAKLDIEDSDDDESESSDDDC